MKTELKYAVIFVVLSFLENCIEYVAGLQDKYIGIHPYIVTPFFIILTLAIYYFALREKKKEFYGRISFSRAFGSGIILTFLIIILNPAFLFVFSEYINPGFYNSFIQHDIQTGKMTPLEAANYYNLSSFIIRGSLYRFIMGIIASLIISLIIRNSSSKY